MVQVLIIHFYLLPQYCIIICYFVLYYCTLLKCMIFCWCDTVCVPAGGVNPPAVSLARLAGLFVNGDLLCYDGRMDEWEGAAGG